MSMNKTVVHAEIHAAVLLFGFAGLFGKLINLPPVTIVWGRTLFAAMTLTVMLLMGRFSMMFIKPRDLIALMLSGALLVAHWSSFFHAIQISTVGIGLITFSTFPLFVTFLEPLFFKERLRRLDILTAGMVVVGLIIIVPRFDISDRMTLGVCWGTFSGLTFAFIALINRHYVRRLSPRVIVLLQQSGAAVFALPAVILSSVGPSLKDTGLMAVLGIVCTAVPQLFYIRSLKMLKAQTAAVILCLEPLYGILLAWLIIREVPAWRTLVGGMLILCAVLLVMRRPVSPLSGRSVNMPRSNK